MNDCTVVLFWNEGLNCRNKLPLSGYPTLILNLRFWFYRYIWFKKKSFIFSTVKEMPSQFFFFPLLSQVPIMGVPVQLMPTWMPMQLQGLPQSISLHQGQLCPGKLQLMLPGKPNWWVVLAMQQYPQLAPRRENGSSTGNRKNRVPRQLRVLPGHCCV